MHVFFFTLSQRARLECFPKLIFQDQELTPHISSVVHTREALILDAYADHRGQSNIRLQICVRYGPSGQRVHSLENSYYQKLVLFYQS